MKYMVCRKDAVDRTIKSSELFPVIVEVLPGDDPESIVMQALNDKWPGYQPINKSYYVVPMNHARLVTFKPKQQFDIIVEDVE